MSVHAFIGSQPLSYEATTIKLTRAHAFVLSIAATFLLPLAIPGVGLDYEFFIITVLVLLAWFIFRWDRIKEISRRSGKAEVFLGSTLIVADYAFNALRQSSVGIVDLLVIFVGAIIASYGIRSLKFFWVPATYGIILLLGYQIESLTPNYVVLQSWLAGVMASILNAVGVGSTATGHVVSMTAPDGTRLLLDVSGPCTGLQGILAFGMLSTLALLDLKPKMSRTIPIFAIGFAGAFLVNIVRLLAMFLTYEYLGVDAGAFVHIYIGYFVFIVWVVAFWAIAYRYLGPVTSPTAQPASMPSLLDSGNPV
ncbi:MAG: exosortase/archaeosortase family protein [Thaumarchaeota archaeon]|nr:exosortase/archaeosortase family protein [Nitrososphaerota archaeon]